MKKLKSGFEVTTSREDLPPRVEVVTGTVAKCMRELEPLFRDDVLFTFVARSPDDKEALIVVTKEEDLAELIQDLTDRQKEM